MKKIRTWLLNITKIAITFGILYYLYAKGLLDFSRVKHIYTQPGVVALVFALLCLAQLIAVLRWSWLLRGQGLELPYSEIFRLTMIGVFFNTAIPGAVSGDLVKGYYVVRKQPNKRGRIKAFTTLLMDRLLGLSALICVSFVAMIFNFESMNSIPSLKPLCGLITLLWVGVVVFFSFVFVEWPFSEKLRKLLHKIPAVGELFGRFYEAVKAYESCRGYIFKGLAVSVFIHSSIVLAFLLLARSFADFGTVPADKFFFLVPFGLLVTAIPVAPAGLGTGHAAFFGLFQLVGSKVGADLFTAYVSFQIAISLIGGLFYMRYRIDIPAEELSAS